MPSTSIFADPSTQEGQFHCKAYAAVDADAVIDLDLVPTDVLTAGGCWYCVAAVPVPARDLRLDASAAVAAEELLRRPARSRIKE